MPAQASSQIDDGFAGAPQSQPLPVFMQDLEFTPMTEAEMAEVRGEAVPDFIRRYIVKVAARAFGNNIALQIDSVLSSSISGATKDELDRLGMPVRSFVYSKLPPWLIPKAAQ